MARRRRVIREKKANLILRALSKYMMRSGTLFSMPNFYIGIWECDLWVLKSSGYQYEYEVKVNRQDFRNDFKKNYSIYNWKTKSENRDFSKHNLIKNGERVNKFYFVCPPGLINIEELPDYAGLLYAYDDKYGYYSFRKIKEAPLLHKEKLYIDRESTLFKIAQKCYYRFAFHRRY